MRRRSLVPMFLFAALAPLACGPHVRTVSEQTIDYHVIPKLQPNPGHTAHESLVAIEGPLLSLILEEPGKPRSVQDIFVRAYGLEHPVPGAYYDIRYREEQVLVNGSRAVSSEIVHVRLNGTQLYPCGGIFRDPCGRPGGCLFCRGKRSEARSAVERLRTDHEAHGGHGGTASMAFLRDLRDLDRAFVDGPNDAGPSPITPPSRSSPGCGAGRRCSRA